MLYFVAVVMGLGVGEKVVLMELTIREWFGSATFGEIFGYLHLAFVAGIALDPLAADYILDITGGGGTTRPSSRESISTSWQPWPFPWRSWRKSHPRRSLLGDFLQKISLSCWSTRDLTGF